MLAMGANDDQVRLGLSRQGAYLVGWGAKTHQGVVRANAVLGG